MAPLLYKDIQKAPNDILSNDYCFDKKFKLTNVTNNGVTFTTEGTLQKAAASGKLTTKFQVDNVSIDKLAVGTDGRVNLEGSFKGLAPGLKVGTKVEDGTLSTGLPDGELNATYSHDLFTVDSKLDLVRGPSLASTATCKYENMLFGGELKLNSHWDEKGSPRVQDFGLAAAYAGEDFVGSIQSKLKFSTFNFAVAHQMNQDTDVAINFEFQPSKTGKKELTVGGTHQLDKDTKFCGKINTSGIVSANYIQVIRPQVKVIASAAVDAKNFSGDSHKFGLQLVLG